MVNEAVAAASSTFILILFKIIMSLILKGVVDDIWSMFLFLQIVVYLTFYDVKIPANVSIYVNEFRNIVSF